MSGEYDTIHLFVKRMLCALKIICIALCNLHIQVFSTVLKSKPYLNLRACSATLAVTDEFNVAQWSELGHTECP